jgi:hypothetical protein
MGSTRSALVMASMVVALGLSPGTVLAQPFPGGLPACLETGNSCQADLDACQTERQECMVELEACMATGPATAKPLLATGQTTCWSYNDLTQLAEVLDPCTGTGQDGDVQAGVKLSYTVNSNGTIMDNNTNLVWAKKSSDSDPIHDVDKQYSWNQAFTHIAQLNANSFGGYTDWRLPNVRELQSIVDYEQRANPSVSPAFNNCPPGTTILSGSCTASAVYWTSTTLARDPRFGLGVSFADGLIAEPSKSATRRVRAVRGGL